VQKNAFSCHALSYIKSEACLPLEEDFCLVQFNFYTTNNEEIIDSRLHPGATFWQTQPNTAVVWHPTGTTNWKYITYCNAVKSGQRHGHRQHVQKLGEIWLHDFFKLCNRQTDRQTQTDRLIAILCTSPGGKVKTMMHIHSVRTTMWLVHNTTSDNIS